MLLVLSALVLAGADVRAETPAEAIRRLTGRHSKVVWLRRISGNTRIFAHPEPNVLIGLDTDDGGVPRVLESEKTEKGSPVITPSGGRVIWNEQNNAVYIIDWDGRNRRKLMDGVCAVGTAEDPPGVEWVYMAEGVGPRDQITYSFLSVVRYQIDNLSIKETVWDKTPSIEKWDFTRDGKYGASRFPSTVASVSLPNGEFKPVANIGCTPGMSSDLLTVFHLLTVHTGVVLYDRDGSNRREIDFGSGPREKGLRPGGYWWVSGAHYDGRFMTFAGPYEGAPGDAQVYFCQFNEQRNGFSEWIRVSGDKEIAMNPYAWIDPEGFGSRPTDKLTAKVLSSAVSRLATAKEFKPILDELAKQTTDSNAAKAADAKKIIAHINGWGASTLRKAQAAEATDLPAAVELYKVLAVRYAGLDVGATAQTRLDDKTLSKDLEAWKYVARILAAEKTLTAPASQRRTFSGQQDLSAVIKGALDALKKDFAGTKAEKTGAEAAARVEAWPKKYLLEARDLEKTKPAEAEAAYEALLGRFPATGSATEAKARLTNKDFRHNLTAWKSYLLPMLSTEKNLKQVPNVKASAKEKQWLQKNKPAVNSMKNSALSIKKDYSDTAAWTEAQTLLAKYDIALDQKY